MLQINDLGYVMGVDVALHNLRHASDHDIRHEQSLHGVVYGVADGGGRIEMLPEHGQGGLGYAVGQTVFGKGQRIHAEGFLETHRV